MRKKASLNISFEACYYSVAVLAENRKSTPEVNFFFLEKRLYQKETFMARNHLKFIKATKEIPPTSSDAALTQVSSKNFMSLSVNDYLIKRYSIFS